MKRTISPFGLLFASVSAIIGSGWLFSAYYSAKLAGPAAIISWIVGGAAVICVAFIFAEICAMLPITGSSTRVPYFTHGTMVSFLFAWMVWLSYAAMTPTEVQAVIQYARFYFPSLTDTVGGLTTQGYVVAVIVMFVVSVINVYSIRWLVRFNIFLTILKIIVPIFMSLMLMYLFFSPHQLIHPDGSTFMPYGWNGVVNAVAMGGIIFAFNGFKQAAEMAGEAKNPEFALPFAIVGSIVICLIIFLLLQTSLISSIEPSNLIAGWRNLTLPGDTSPFASLLHEHRIFWFLPILYFGAVVAPMAAGFMYTASSSRSLFGMSKSGHFPPILQKLNAFGNPVIAIIANFFVGILMFSPLPGWDKMAAFLTSLLAITYGIGPINMLALRYQLPNQARPFRLPLAKLWSTTAFFVCNMLAYWSGWTTISKLSIALGMGVVVLIVYRSCSAKARKQPLNWRASLWIWPYFVGLSLISYLGDFGGGMAVLKFGWDFLVMALFSVFIMWLAMKFKLPAEETKRHVDESLNPQEFI